MRYGNSISIYKPSDSTVFIRILIVLCVLVLPVLAWLSAVPEPWNYLASDVPQGQLLYVFSKLAGLVAISLLTLQLSLILARKSLLNLVPGMFSWTFHYRLGIVTALTVLIHVGLFVSAASLRAGSLNLQLLLPNWHGFYNSMVSIGVLALFLVVVLVLLGVLLKRGLAVNKLYHQRIALLSVVLVFVHSYAIGSETHLPLVRLFYGTLAVALLFSVLSSLHSWRQRSIKSP